MYLQPVVKFKAVSRSGVEVGWEELKRGEKRKKKKSYNKADFKRAYMANYHSCYIYVNNQTKFFETNLILQKK